jgi:xanthine dehydrogenase accessory factor
MRPDLLLLAAELVKKGEPFALAVVVRREPATSARLGDLALVTEGGRFHGWLGGSCTQPTLVREVRRALADGVPRLVALSPDPAADRRPGVVAVPLTCASGGSVDIYVEPFLPAPRLVVFGASPAAQAMARVGKAMGYLVDVADPEADAAAFPSADRLFKDLQAEPLARRTGGDSARPMVIVATMGQRDEEALLAALAMEAGYIGLVASRRRFEQIKETLALRGVSAESMARIKNPAGLDIGAESPEEVAVSIVAEIVQQRRAAAKAASARAAEGAGGSPAGMAVASAPAETGEAIDPVCGMTVDVASARHRAELGGRSYFFCCGGCRERFLAAPERYGAGQAMAGGGS